MALTVDNDEGLAMEVLFFHLKVSTVIIGRNIILKDGFCSQPRLTLMYLLFEWPYRIRVQT